MDNKIEHDIEEAKRRIERAVILNEFRSATKSMNEHFNRFEIIKFVEELLE